MKKSVLIGTVILALGVVLLVFGINAANSPVEQVGEAITGRYSDQTMAYLISGGVAAVVGFVVLVRK